MSLTVELTGTGLIWRDASGQQVAGIVAVSGIGEGVLVLRGNLPAETSLTPEQWQHVSRIAAEIATNARIAGEVDGWAPCMPRLPAAGDTCPPMG